MEKISEQPREQMPTRNTPAPEQIRYFEAHPEDIRGEFMNNFHMWIPGSASAEWTKKYHTANDIHRMQAIAHALEAMPEVHEALEEGKVLYAKEEARLNDILVPVYLQLRKEGFSHYDLVR